MIRSSWMMRVSAQIVSTITAPTRRQSAPLDPYVCFGEALERTPVTGPRVVFDAPGKGRFDPVHGTS
jgi:hypothetical protein